MFAKMDNRTNIVYKEMIKLMDCPDYQDSPWIVQTVSRLSTQSRS